MTNARATPLTHLSSRTAGRSLTSDTSHNSDSETGPTPRKEPKLTSDPPNSTSVQFEMMANATVKYKG